MTSDLLELAVVIVAAVDDDGITFGDPGSVGSFTLVVSAVSIASVVEVVATMDVVVIAVSMVSHNTLYDTSLTYLSSLVGVFEDFFGVRLIGLAPFLAVLALLSTCGSSKLVSKPELKELLWARLLLRLDVFSFPVKLAVEPARLIALWTPILDKEPFRGNAEVGDRFKFGEIGNEFFRFDFFIEFLRLIPVLGLGLLLLYSAYPLAALMEDGRRLYGRSTDA